MRRTAEALGVGHTFRKTPVGVYFGKPGETVADPYFGGAGPARTGCTLCGNCMVGCRDGAKNTLRKNYLWFAEQAGVTIEPLRTVVDVRPLDPARPEVGYAVTTERTGAWVRKDRRTVTAGQVVVAAGTWGTQKLLHAMRTGPRAGLPRLSPALGRLTRTNSEALAGTMVEKVPPGTDLTRASRSRRRSTSTSRPTSRTAATARAATRWGCCRPSRSTAAAACRAGCAGSGRSCATRSSSATRCPTGGGASGRSSPSSCRTATTR